MSCWQAEGIPATDRPIYDPLINNFTIMRRHLCLPDIMECITLTHVRVAYQGMSSGIHTPLPLKGQDGSTIVRLLHTGMIK